MEKLNSALILLEVSQNGSHFLVKNTDQEELSGWQSVEKPMVISPCFVEKQGRKSIVDSVGEKEQSFSSFGNVNKGLGSPNRLLLGPSLYKSHEGFHVKFEHFSRSSQFIEQYRRAKEVRFQAALSKLMQHRGVKSSGHEIVETKTKSVSGPEQRQDKERSNQEFVYSVTPSLPQTGYFTGKKWVFPKDMRSVNDNCGSKCGSKLQVNKPGIQVHNVRNMFLKGTGKPINTTCKKTWTVPKQRPVNCKSAPVRSSRRSHAEKIRSQNNFTQTNCMTSPSQSEPTNCIHVSSLMTGHQGASLVPKRTHQSFEQLEKTWKSVGYMARGETTVNNNIHSVKIC